MVITHHCLDSFLNNTSADNQVLTLFMFFFHTCHVPVFLIISGYFCHEQPIGKFYLSKVKRIFVPFAFFSFLKLFYSVFILNEFSQGGTTIAEQVKYSLVIGRQYWFVYTILGCFFAAPLFWTKIDSIKSNGLAALIISYLVICSIWLSRLSLPIYFQFDRIVNYLPYFIFGCALKQNQKKLSLCTSKKMEAILAIVSVLLITAYMYIYTFYQSIRNYPIRFWVALSFFIKFII